MSCSYKHFDVIVNSIRAITLLNMIQSNRSNNLPIAIGNKQAMVSLEESPFKMYIEWRLNCAYKPLG